MTSKLTTVQVKAKHLKGDVSCNLTCPIAQALTDAGFEEVSVGTTVFHFTENGMRVDCKLPRNAVDEMEKWFNFKPRKPFTFEFSR